MRWLFASILLGCAGSLVACGNSAPIGSSSGASGGLSTTGSRTGGGASSGGSSSGLGSGTVGTTGTTTGGPGCVTAADCPEFGVACLDGGYCGTPAVSPSLVCLSAGQPCSAATAPCCDGACGATGVCQAWQHCAVVGEACASKTCCADAVCQSGSCVPGCGRDRQVCGQDADCCTQEGLSCLAPSTPNGHAKECLPHGGTSCVPSRAGGGTECNLGTACALQSGIDPCASAGLICDSSFGACRDPAQFELCLPGGPPCQGIANSDATSLACIELPRDGYAECLQPCAATSDCLGEDLACKSITSVEGQACFGNYGCANYFGACNAQGAGDGTCVPISTSTGIQGICYQSDSDAGVACDHASNRENDGFCASGQRCFAGICSELCNVGTFGGGPSCGADVCLSNSPETTDPTDQGICEPACDVFAADGGGCTSVSGVPQKCIPELLDGLVDQGAGLCALAVANPPGLGAPCSQADPLHVDTCGPGQACASLHSGGEIICVQLCPDIGQQSTCPSGKSCLIWHHGSISSTTFGFCD